MNTPRANDPQRGARLALIGGVLFAERVTERCALDAARSERQNQVRAVLTALAQHAADAASALERHWDRFSDVPAAAPATSSSTLPTSVLTATDLGKSLSRSIDLMQLLSACCDEPLELRQFCADWLAQRFALGWALKEALNDRESLVLSATIVDP